MKTKVKAMEVTRKVKPCLMMILLLMVLSCVSENKKQPELELASDKNTFYQYNIWLGFVNKVFDGDLTVKELKTRGDIGLGSYTQLDGELVMLNGIAYRVREDGIPTIANNDDKIVYVDAAFFEPESSFQINQPVNYDSLRGIINNRLTTLNQFYAFRIEGDFSYMKCGGINKQEKPYTDGLDVIIPARPVFERTNFKGTIVGFFCPEFIGNINVAGYHFHFISEDKQFGGHVMAFEANHLMVEVDPLLDYHFTLPGSNDFFNVSLDKQFQYGTK